MKLGQDKFELGEIYRNQAVKCCKLMSKDDFEKLECTFSTEYDPKTKGPLSQTWTKEAFNQFVGDDDEDSLFKLCAQEEIKKADLENKIKLST